MSVVRWDPFTVLARLDGDFDELVRRAWGGPVTARSGRFVPAVDVSTEGSDVVIRFEVPGVDIERDLDIEVHKGRLTVSGSRRQSEERKERDGKVLVRELRYGSFRRDFALPEHVAAEDITATYDAGILEVRVGNATKPVEAPHKVAISAKDGANGATGAAEVTSDDDQS
jgi:HSP20 family protein